MGLGDALNSDERGISDVLEDVEDEMCTKLLIHNGEQRDFKLLFA